MSVIGFQVPGNVVTLYRVWWADGSVSDLEISARSLIRSDEIMQAVRDVDRYEVVSSAEPAVAVREVPAIRALAHGHRHCHICGAEEAEGAVISTAVSGSLDYDVCSSCKRISASADRA
jgi:hypothetical protein